LSNRLLYILSGIIAGVLFSTVAFGQSLRIDDIAAQKVCFKPDETASFAASITYLGTQPKELTCKMQLISELDNTEPVMEQRISFSPGEKKTITGTWKVPGDRKWGHSLRLEVAAPGEATQVGWAFFAVGKYPWQVGHWAGVCNFGMLADAKEVDQKLVGIYKRWHNTAVDVFSWQPSGWESMAPVQDEWRSGQTGYKETKANIKALIDGCHKSGVNVFSYIISASWGPAGVEFIRTHPQWWNYDRFGRPFPGLCNFDVEILDKMSGTEIVPGSTGQWFSSGVLWRPEMKEYMLNQLKKSVEMFGWDGFRSDGLPAPGNVYDSQGKFHKVVSDDADEEQMKWNSYVQNWMKKNIGPDCLMHYNAGSVSYGLEKQSKKAFQAKARGVYCLWEGAYLASLAGTDLNNMKTFAKYLHDEVAASREVGGYRHCGYMLSTSELQEATGTACGAQLQIMNGWDNQPSPATWGPYPYRSFTFRFSRFFWDPDIRHIVDSSKLFDVKAPSRLWWDDLVQQRIEKDGTRYLMVHMINLPENYPANQQPAEPAKDVTVTFKNSSNKQVDAFVLTPDGTDVYSEFAKPIAIEKTQDGVTVKVPDIKLWSVVVFKERKN
jgi:hypothetical protein